MKNILLFLSIVLLWISCNNDIDLVEEWKDVPIVYGLIDPADTAHYIRIEKAFIDPEISGAELAKNIDSIYYSDIEVNLINESIPKNPISYQLERVDGNLEGYPRKDGAFADAPNYLYKIKASDIELEGSENLKLQILRGEGKEEVTSNINIVGKFDFIRPRPDDPEKIHLSYANHLSIRWDYSDYAVDYEVYIITHYEEKMMSEPDEMFVPKSVIWKAGSEIEENFLMLESKQYFTFMSSALEENIQIERSFDELEFVVVAVGKEISDFIEIVGANLGITASQEIPLYSNLTEGLGVFSSKWAVSLDGLRMATPTLDSLENGVFTKHLNFK